MNIKYESKIANLLDYLGGIYTYKASEKALAKNWLTKEEDNAWKHLEKEI